jgi:hypothetical protein
MNLHEGDRVKFLNTKGGGVVSRIIDSRMVSVIEEGGFEIPTLASELVKISDDEPGARFFNESFSPGAAKEKTQETDPKSGDDRLSLLSQEIRNKRKTEDIFMAFVPHDQKWLITGLLDVYLINNTSFDILYNFIRRTDTDLYAGVDYGSVFPGSKLLVATIEREEIGTWTEGYMQFLFHKDRSQGLLPPFNSEISIKGAKFFNEASYRESPVIEGKGIVVKIVSLHQYFESRKEKVKDTAEELPANPAGGPALIDRYRTAPREAEVDLHIHELVEDYSNMDNNEILEFQRSFFTRCLEDAIARHYSRVIFIHGVGNGTLRESILSLLKNYGGIEVFDAPMQKFGVGAVDVRIPHNG